MLGPELLCRIEECGGGGPPEGRFGTPGREGRDGPPAADGGIDGFGGLYEE